MRTPCWNVLCWISGKIQYIFPILNLCVVSIRSTGEVSVKSFLKRSDAFHDVYQSPDPLVLQYTEHALVYFPFHSGFPPSESSMHPAVLHTHLCFNKLSRKGNNSGSRDSTHRDSLTLTTWWDVLSFPLLPWKPLSALSHIKLKKLL